jgi:phosphate-selective porin OprO/OprP
MTEKYTKNASALVLTMVLGICGAGALSTNAYAQSSPSKTKPAKKKPFITAKISGRVMIDYTNARAKKSDLDITDFDVRRIYYGVSGKIGKEFSYSTSGSISDTGALGLVGATVDWKPKGSKIKVRIGQFKTPMSLDESTSSKYTSTHERAAFTDAVEIDRRLGVAVYHSGKKHTFAAGAFGGHIEHQPFSSGTALAVRGTYAVVHDNDQTVHLGASIRYRTNNKDLGDIRYRQRPYAHISDRILSTGKIAKSDVVIASEAAFIRKNFWMAGEYTLTNANCSSCKNDPNFDAYYVEAGLFFGGRKTYGGGSFGRPKVYKPLGKGGRGALSIVARYDSVDLSDRKEDGGKLGTTILGLDWYPTSHTRLGVNYFNADATFGDRSSGLGKAFNNLRKSGAPGETVEGVTFRVQYDF